MPNVLLICADQMRADCLSAANHPTVRTPNLDALAAEGARFANHYTVTVPCGPARASLLTGLYLFNHRSVANGAPLAASHQTLAQLAEARGLDCLVFGYTDTTPDPRCRPPQSPAFRHYQSVAASFHPMSLWRGDNHEDWLAYLAARGYAPKNAADDIAAVLPQPDAPPRPFTNAPAPYAAADSDTAYLTDQCISHLRANGRRRDWLIMLAYLRPHPPLVAPAPYHNLYPDSPPLPKSPTVADEARQHPFLAEWLAAQNAPGYYQNGLRARDISDDEWRAMRNVYYGLVSEVDHHIGRVIDCLRATGLLDDTLVIFTSDHAEMLGGRWCWGKGGYFDGAYHCPLIIRDPRATAARGRQITAFTESIDITPTITNWLALGGGGQRPQADAAAQVGERIAASDGAGGNCGSFNAAAQVGERIAASDGAGGNCGSFNAAAQVGERIAASDGAGGNYGGGGDGFAKRGGRRADAAAVGGGGAGDAAAMDGRSLRGWLGDETPADWREAAFFECDFRHADYRRRGALAQLANDECVVQIWRGSKYKYVHFGGDLPPLLFDVEADPGEFVNIAAAAPEVVSRARAALLNHRARHAPQQYANQIATPHGLTSV